MVTGLWSLGIITKNVTKPATVKASYVVESEKPERNLFITYWSMRLFPFCVNHYTITLYVRCEHTP